MPKCAPTFQHPNIAFRHRGSLGRYRVHVHEYADSNNYVKEMYARKHEIQCIELVCVERYARIYRRAIVKKLDHTEGQSADYCSEHQSRAASTNTFPRILNTLGHKPR